MFALPVLYRVKNPVYNDMGHICFVGMIRYICSTSKTDTI